MTGEILLRDVVETDLPYFYEHQRDPVAAAMAAFPSRELDAFMSHWKKILADESNILKTILYDGQVAGNVVSFYMNGHREVGYWLGRAFWGKGIASRALALFLEIEQARPLYGYVARGNTGSLRVLQKCGFVLDREEGEELALVLGRER